MLDMSFITRKVAGTEFIEFQNATFKDELTACLDQYIMITDKRVVLSPECQVDVLGLIKKHTGFSNIKLELNDSGNLYIDAGYFSPNHVLNNTGTDVLIPASKTTLYRWFVENKNKIFKGGVDYRSGKVTGSFQDVPLTIGINVNLHQFFPLDKITKWKVSMGGALAGGIAHELGHAFGGCALLLTHLEDNLVARAGLDQYRKATKAEERVIILKDTAAILDVPEAKLEELKSFANQEDGENYLLYYTKLLSQRNSRRSLSVGVPEMTSEVIADMYAIRMGFSKEVIAGISALVDRGVFTIATETFLFGAVATLFLFWPTAAVTIIVTGGTSALGGMLWGVFALSSAFAYFQAGYSGVYNSDHRRMEDALRQLIAKLKASKTVPGEERVRLIDDITKALEAVKKLKPWYDNTVLYRFIGWIFSGSDFRKQEIEHFTQSLNNHELAVLSSQLKTL
ncbi:SDR family oxidoreductase [Pseudomonas aeruginosa]|uniref:SDR family oxidoreductase n=2 Tax=Pseudomonas aeruginosa TaxID=287 RepID=UPI00114F7D9D|nr:SDR family oxidoreductase [Pseudomonas aeruginosa]TQH49587.1 SDR family oxidoreductase [Pseudomonas aeruginosa]